MIGGPDDGAVVLTQTDDMRDLVRKIRDDAIAAAFDTTSGDGETSTVVDLSILESILLDALLDVGR